MVSTLRKAKYDYIVKYIGYDKEKFERVFPSIYQIAIHLGVSIITIQKVIDGIDFVQKTMKKKLPKNLIITPVDKTISDVDKRELNAHKMWFCVACNHSYRISGRNYHCASKKHHVNNIKLIHEQNLVHKDNSIIDGIPPMPSKTTTKKLKKVQEPVVQEPVIEPVVEPVKEPPTIKPKHVFTPEAREKSSAWVKAVKAYKEKHPGLQYRQCLIDCSELKKQGKLY